jgi:hypothetical protein
MRILIILDKQHELSDTAPNQITSHRRIQHDTKINRNISYYTVCAVPSMSSFSSASLELPLTSAFCPKAEGLASQYLKGKEERKDRNRGTQEGEWVEDKEGRKEGQTGKEYEE